MWTIGSVHLEDFIKDHSVCWQPNDTVVLSRDDANFAQTYVAIVSNGHFPYGGH